MEFANATLSDVLDDLASRFIINVPDEELQSVERICFQIEQAHWFYEDFSTWSTTHEQAFADFMTYKIRVPVCGGIILNDAMTKVLLVKGWSARSNWSFPRGKINKDEPELQCGVREVMEETGFDMTPYLITTGYSRTTSDDGPEPDFIEIIVNEQRVRLYIALGVPEDTHFETRTRKEISKIEWHLLQELPGYSQRDGAAAKKNKNHYYTVLPFLGYCIYPKIKGWVSRQKKHTRRQRVQSTTSNRYATDTEPEDLVHGGGDPKQQQQQQPETAVNVTDQLKRILGVTNGLTANTQMAAPLLSPASAQDASQQLKLALGLGIAPSPPPSIPAQAVPPADAPAPALAPRAASLLSILNGSAMPPAAAVPPHKPTPLLVPAVPPASSPKAKSLLSILNSSTAASTTLPGSRPPPTRLSLSLSPGAPPMLGLLSPRQQEAAVAAAADVAVPETDKTSSGDMRQFRFDVDEIMKCFQ
ncbi:mRNA-decapping enzyme subunit 2 [Sorochytrium milnesiophthora]